MQQRRRRRRRQQQQQQQQNSFQNMKRAQHEDCVDSYTEYSSESITQVQGEHGQEKMG